jgi:hypothetical protein
MIRLYSLIKEKAIDRDGDRENVLLAANAWAGKNL